MHRLLQDKSVIHGTLQLPLGSQQALEQRWAARSDRDHLVVAEIDGAVVALGGLHVSHRPRQRHVAELGMMVAEAWQGRGVGRAVLDALLDLGERWLGILRFDLEVFVDNEPARRLYQSRGFEIEGVARAFALRDGKLVDAFRMARVAPATGWQRTTAEDVANRRPPELPSGEREPPRPRKRKRDLPN